MEEIGVSLCKAKPDVWNRPALKTNGVECYQHALLYTDEILANVEEPERLLIDELGKKSTLNKRSIGFLEQHVGNKISQVTFENSVKV